MKHICIIGASSGIGKELAKNYSTDTNIHLSLVVRSKDAKKELEKLLSWKVHIHVSDLEERDERKKLLSKLKKDHIDTLIYAAGVGYYKKFFEQKSKEISAQSEVNTTFVAELIHALYKDEKQRKSWVFVYLSSIISEIPAKHISVYGASKLNTKRMLQTIGAEYPDFHYVLVQLWAVKTPMHIKSWYGQPIWRDPKIVAEKIQKLTTKKRGIYTPFISWKIQVYLIFPVVRIFM